MSRTYRKASSFLKRNAGQMFWHSKFVRDGQCQHVSTSCSNHGGCPYCESNRTHKHRKQSLIGQENGE